MTESEDRSASGTDQVKNTGDSLSLGERFPSKSKMMNGFQNKCII